MKQLPGQVDFFVVKAFRPGALQRSWFFAFIDNGSPLSHKHPVFY
jgi:hypothetical protein